MFPGNPEEWEREWRFKERLKQVESLLVKHREAMNQAVQENRELKKDNQKLLRSLVLLRRERERVKELLVRMEKRLEAVTKKGRGHVGKKET